jgi:hypothetical protein
MAGFIFFRETPHDLPPAGAQIAGSLLAIIFFAESIIPRS